MCRSPLTGSPRLGHSTTISKADADDLATAYTNCGVAIAAAARWKVPAALAAAYSLRTSVARRSGDLPGADRDGETASGLLDHPRCDAAVLLRARRIAIRLDIGDPDGAGELLAGLGAELPDGGSLLALRYARARLHAATDRLGEGLADLFFCGERLAARQADRPGVLRLTGAGHPRRRRLHRRRRRAPPHPGAAVRGVRGRR